jgi:hypothetical protein
MQPLRLWSSTCLIAAVTVSPDLILANLPNVASASAFQFPGSEPVEIFQAELFTILEKLASGATQLSAEDELKEMESQDDDSSANPPVNDETVLIPFVNVRPAFAVLPEFRTALSLNCSGRLEAPPAEHATPEQADAFLLESAAPSSMSTEVIEWADDPPLARQPQTNDQPNEGVPEGESIDDLAFSAEITRAESDDNLPAEELPATKLASPKKEPVRQSLPDYRSPGGEREKQHAAEAPAPRVQSSNEAAVATQKLDFEPLTRPEPKRDATPVAPAAPLVEAAEPHQQTPAIAPQPLRDLSMGIVSDQTRIGIQLRESEGTLQVSVRTPDAAVSAALQQNLDELAATLSKQGMDAQFWTPGEDHRIEPQSSESAGDSGQSSPDWQGQGNSGRDSSSQQRQNQRSRAGWLNTFTKEQDADTKDKEVTSWPFTSQTFQTRR